MKTGQKVLLKQTRSLNKRTKVFRETVRALGLGRIGKQREVALNECLIGMIRKVAHVIEIKAL